MIVLATIYMIGERSPDEEEEEEEEPLATCLTWGYRTTNRVVALSRRVIALSRGVIALHRKNYTFIRTGK